MKKSICFFIAFLYSLLSCGQLHHSIEPFASGSFGLAFGGNDESPYSSNRVYGFERGTIFDSDLQELYRLGDPRWGYEPSYTFGLAWTAEKQNDNFYKGWTFSLDYSAHRLTTSQVWENDFRILRVDQYLTEPRTNVRLSYHVGAGRHRLDFGLRATIVGNPDSQASVQALDLQSGAVLEQYDLDIGPFSGFFWNRRASGAFMKYTYQLDRFKMWVMLDAIEMITDSDYDENQQTQKFAVFNVGVSYALLNWGKQEGE